MVGQEGEDHGEHRLAGDLPSLVQPEGAPLVDLDVVVDEPQGSEADDDEQCEQAAGGEGCRLVMGDVGGGIGNDGRADDDEAPHRRRPLLGDVGLRAVLPDALADALGAQDADGHGGAEQGQGQRQAGRDHETGQLGSAWTP